MEIIEHKPKENLFMPDSMRLHSGKYLNLLTMDPESIDIKDIAHGISHQCRFAGHMQRFYSVAQHSVWGSYRMETNEEAFEFLMHDSSEGYLVDIPSPLKKLLPDYYVIEAKLMKVISDKYGVNYPMSPAVKKMDAEALEYEWYNGVLSDNLDCWPQEYAKKNFLNRFNELYNAIRR